MKTKSQPAPWRFIHPSNLVTYISIVAAFLAVVQAWSHNRNLAGFFLGLSVLADPLDGKFARLFKRSNEEQLFGVQIDSLADTVAFCVAPAVCGVLLLSSPGAIDWPLFAAAFFHLLCGVTRLGYYNVHASETADFVGIPTTVIGLAWVFILAFPPSFSLYIASYLVGGALMVSPIPLKRPTTKVLLAVLLVALAGIGWHLSLAL